ncbi:hypothetical protein HCI99_04795 [Listeria booriae]|uniref:Uncharacterized protein n=1 Tax=Listeria booriae TaxID=1552123 RepID=A0A7X0XB95_9LIST|nr:hypothetical protein [Listeria booriae]MBC1490949.1 hypothetical protein [Listeria booriae]MBC1491136.1 hypothetical protein [Listeria booriae]MBC6151032.1 hypothetical protein [Listeria booriae]MBC6151219.1 hypothetical protein [Listeria booriae]
MDYKKYIVERAALDHKINLTVYILVILLIAIIILMFWACLKTSLVRNAILLYGKMAVLPLCAVLFGVCLLAPVQFENLRVELRNTQQKEWFTEKKQTIVNLETDKSSKVKGTFFLGSGNISSDNEKFYVFAVKSQQGVQLKQTDEQFKDIKFSDIYIQEKAVEKPYYLLEKRRYKDKRVAKILNESIFIELEKERLTFVVPPNTIKSNFGI